MSPQDDVQLVANQGWDERVLVARCGPLVDAFIVVSRRYVVIVDTLINPQTATAMLSAAQEYLRGDRRLLVVNTHADFDHCWGNQIFAGPAALHPAPIIASRQCAEQFRSPEAKPFLEQMQAREPERFGEVQFAPPTVLFDERLTIDGGDLTLDLFATPGHSPDHISAYIPETGVLLAGDAAEAPYPSARSVASLPALRKSLPPEDGDCSVERMIALDPTHALYCHAPVTLGAPLLRYNQQYFDVLEQRCKAALERGLAAQLGVPPTDGDYLESDDVEALVGCSFKAAIPASLDTAELHEFYRTAGHRAQLRMMLEHLGSQQFQGRIT